MSRPFDSTNDWWREELRELGQIVHQAHTLHVKETWRTCSMASCSRIRAILDESKTELDVTEFPLEDVVSVVIRRRKSDAPRQRRSTRG